MSCLMTETALLWQDSVGFQKEIERCGAKLASLKKLEDEVTVSNKNVANILTFVT